MSVELCLTLFHRSCSGPPLDLGDKVAHISDTGDADKPGIGL